MKPTRKLLAVLTSAAWFALPAIVILSIALAVPACKKQELRSKGYDRASLNDQPGISTFEQEKEKKPETAGKPSAQPMRKVITTHDMTVEVKNLATAFQTAIDLAKASNGYTIETSRVRNEDGSYLGRVVMRVPPGKAGGLLEKLRAARRALKKGKTIVVRTHVRDMVVLPEFVGLTVGIYNGMTFIEIVIVPEMVGRYIGEFAPTNKAVHHGAPGIGATKSSQFVPLK